PRLESPRGRRVASAALAFSGRQPHGEPDRILLPRLAGGPAGTPLRDGAGHLLLGNRGLGLVHDLLRVQRRRPRFDAHWTPPSRGWVRGRLGDRRVLLHAHRPEARRPEVSLVVAAAGALGAVCRYLIGGLMQSRVGWGFPVGTLVVNLEIGRASCRERVEISAV